LLTLYSFGSISLKVKTFLSRNSKNSPLSFDGRRA
jgi:hypothetical protein